MTKDWNDYQEKLKDDAAQVNLVEVDSSSNEHETLFEWERNFDPNDYYYACNSSSSEHRGSVAEQQPDYLLRQMIHDEFERYGKPVVVDTITIGLWPNGSATSGADEPERKRQKEHIEHLVGFFVVAWFIVLFWHMLHGSFLNLLINFKGFFALLVIPLFTMIKGSTHIIFNEMGFDIVSMSVTTTKVRKRVLWTELSRVYLDGKKKPTVLDQSVCFETQAGKTHRIKLRKIANRGQWIKLMEALERWSGLNLDGLEKDVFDSLSADRSSPTYTMLWLETLAAPPRRERLTPLTEGTLLRQGRYKLERQLGAGGQGSAFLASSTADGSPVVLKEYILPIYVDNKARKQALERFEHEAKMLSGLDHTSIVKLIDYFLDDHRAYLVLEYIDGDNLQQYVQKNGRLPDARALEYANALVDILSYLHNQSPPVVHRDFTPDNLIVAKTGEVKLIDFMVAQQSDPQEESTDTTVAGKTAYMAPEQFRGQNRPQSDIYAFGATLYYLLTATEPEPITQLHPLLQNDNCHPTFNEIVSKCTEADPGKRYSHIDEIRAQLKSIQDDVHYNDCNNRTPSEKE